MPDLNVVVLCSSFSVERASQLESCANKPREIINSRPFWIHYVTTEAAV